MIVTWKKKHLSHVRRCPIKTSLVIGFALRFSERLENAGMVLESRVHRPFAVLIHHWQTTKSRLTHSHINGWYSIIKFPSNWRKDKLLGNFSSRFWFKNMRHLRLWQRCWWRWKVFFGCYAVTNGNFRRFGGMFCLYLPIYRVWQSEKNSRAARLRWWRQYASPKRRWVLVD